MAPRLEGAAEADCRRGDGQRARDRGLCRSAPDGGRGPDEGRPRHLLERGRRGQARRPGVMSVRTDGLGGPSLPHVHVGDDCEAEGDRTLDGRLPRRHGDDSSLHLRPEARRRRLLVRGRHRLDHRAQLHRLRAAGERRDVGDLRGDPGLPGQGSLVGHRRALRRDDPLHGADGHPRAHEVGPGARREARSLVAAPPRVGRRADQPGGLDVVPRAHRRRADAGRRHLVADRDRDGPDHAAPGPHDDQAGLGDQAVPRGRRGHLR